MNTATTENDGLPSNDNVVTNNVGDVGQQQPQSGGRRPDRKRSNSRGETIVFNPSSVNPNLTASGGNTLFPERRVIGEKHELMGPLLRRKKVVSMPLGAGGDFFVSHDVGGPHRQFMDQPEEFAGTKAARRVRQHSVGVPTAASREFYTSVYAEPTGGHLARQKTPPVPRRQKQSSGGAVFMQSLVRRKQVSLDLLGPNDFFATPSTPAVIEEGEACLGLEMTPEEEVLKPEESEREEEKKKLFAPLRFSARLVRAGGDGGRAGGHAGGHGGGDGPQPAAQEAAPVDPEASKSFNNFTRSNQEVRLQLLALQKQLAASGEDNKEFLDAVDGVLKVQSGMKNDEQKLKSVFHPDKLGPSTAQQTGEELDNTATKEEDDSSDDLKKGVDDDDDDDYYDHSIIRATHKDKVKTAILFVLMLAITVVVASWETHVDEHSFILKPIGLACDTVCLGDVETKDFFHGHNHFEKGEVIKLEMNIDPQKFEEHEKVYATVDIVGEHTGEIKASYDFGPADHHERLAFDHKFVVDFDDPDEHHVINVYSTAGDAAPLSFTLHAAVEAPLSDSSVIIAAVLMVVVYLFILLEVIHRTLVAVFGSMIALMFYFIMSGGETESIRIIMLNLEWSTLGLLFGMMLIVGELSHTGIFEWCAVRLLVASKGSFQRLIVLLCLLTAVASAFLDNVTTMLLVAPVTIDMCNILEVDPRPYLIGEVLLSNIGGTATLIGDPPNIIIGSSFSEIGFVDFIIHVLPCIFVFCVPLSLMVVVHIYKFYLTSTQMRVLDTKELKKTYPIYDEPRLMIAGTVTLFVILMFFLHPVHHKDTAWVALLGAFITISFTNPHDVQDALRNHVEWDTLLFFAGLFVLVEVCAHMGLLEAIGDLLADYIAVQDEDQQLTVAISLILWVSAITSAFLDNIPYTATMIPVIQILADQLPDTLPLETLAWALSFGACLGGNGTLLGASANIVTAGISTNKGFEISFLNFLYPGMLVMIISVAISNIYMLVRYVWI